MAAPDIRNFDIPVGPLRDRIVMSVGNDDIEIPDGFICQVAAPVAAGILTYQTVAGSADQSETLAAGSFPNSCGIPVMLKVIRGTSTVTSVVIGVL